MRVWGWNLQKICDYKRGRIPLKKVCVFDSSLFFFTSVFFLFNQHIWLNSVPLPQNLNHPYLFLKGAVLDARVCVCVVCVCVYVYVCVWKKGGVVLEIMTSFGEMIRAELSRELGGSYCTPRGGRITFYIHKENRYKRPSTLAITFSKLRKL